MNFLAHAYLSKDHPELLVGNLFADFVRGKQIDNFPHNVRQGIRLHRDIDAYTDTHPVVREAKYLFADSAHRYGSSFLDVSFDHFLAIDAQREPNEGWMKFTHTCFDKADVYLHLLHPDYHGFFNSMRSENWLYNYRHKWLIEKNFGRMKRHLKFLDEDADIYGDFERNYLHIEEAYHAFFPDLERFVETHPITVDFR